jgi:hypothetical protein
VNISSETTPLIWPLLLSQQKNAASRCCPSSTPQAVDLEKNSPDELYAKAKKVAIALAT